MRGKFLTPLSTPENTQAQYQDAVNLLRSLLPKDSTVYVKLTYRNTSQDCNDDGIGVRGYTFYAPYLKTVRDDVTQEERQVPAIEHITRDVCIVTGYRWYNGPDIHPYIIDATYLVTNQAIMLCVKELARRLYDDINDLKYELWR